MLQLRPLSAPYQYLISTALVVVKSATSREIPEAESVFFT